VLAQIRYGQEVHSPLVERGTAQVLGSLERIESLRYADYLAADGLAVVSSQMVLPVTVSSGQARYPEDAEARIRAAFPRLIYLDAIGLAVGIGNARCSNLVILGALASGYLFAFLQDVPLTPGEYCRQIAEALGWRLDTDLVAILLKACVRSQGNATELPSNSPWTSALGWTECLLRR